jgi:hypothetical protein
MAPHEGRHPQVEGLPEALRQAGQQVDLAAGPSQVAEAGKIGGPEVVGGELGHPQRATGRPIAHELGIHDSSLVNRVRQDPIDRGEREGLSTDQRAHLRELELYRGPAPLRPPRSGARVLEPIG